MADGFIWLSRYSGSLRAGQSCPNKFRFFPLNIRQIANLFFQQS